MDENKQNGIRGTVFTGDFFDDLSSMVDDLQEEGKKRRELSQTISGNGSKSHVIQLLYERALECIREQDFTTADLLRTRLYQIDPSAVREIFELGRIIEVGKRILSRENDSQMPLSSDPDDEERDEMDSPEPSSVNRTSGKGIELTEFSAHWFDFYNGLENTELTALSKVLHPFESEDIMEVITQGAVNSKLYFIQTGGVTLSRKDKRRVKTHSVLSSGDVFGDDTFFSVSQSSVSAMVHSQSSLLVLYRDDLEMICRDYPGIDKKLHAICFSRKHQQDSGNPPLMPRLYPRYPVKGIVSAQLLNTNGHPVGRPFGGSIIDISMGGMAFTVRKTNEEIMQYLYGQSLNTAIDIDMNESGGDLLWGGVVVGVNKVGERSYSIHINGYDENRQIVTLLDMIQKQRL